MNAAGPRQARGGAAPTATPRPSRAADAAVALEARRKRGVMAIKAAQRTLGLDDGAYRDLLEAQTTLRTREGDVIRPGKRSATTLTLAEQGRVLDYMRAQGAKHPTRGAGRPRTAVPAEERQALLSKVHGLLSELSRLTGEAHSLAYADAICKRNAWAERVDFCAPQDLHRLVGALARTCRTKARRAGVWTFA
jgi:phage gp16-like protein